MKRSRAIQLGSEPPNGNPIEIQEGRLRFRFPGDWNASKFDGWVFYRTQFLHDFVAVCSECEGQLRCTACNRRVSEGASGVDILAVANGTCWLIEIKDYVQRPIASLEFLADAVAKKVKDTLAALVIARHRATEREEREQARLALDCNQFRVVLHLEQPPTRSRLHPCSTRQANVTEKLLQLVRCIDPAAAVVSMAVNHDFGWTVQAI